MSRYDNPRNKIGRMVAAGELFPVRRGLYETNRTVPGCCLAPCIYGPSYLSFEYALARHGLLPEEVRTYTSATCTKRRTRHFEGLFGRFDYRDVPVSVFPLFVELAWEHERPYWLASPEKALCDQLYKLPPVTNRSALEELLFENLRIDIDSIARLDVDALGLLAARYHSRSVSLLCAYVERIQR